MHALGFRIGLPGDNAEAAARAANARKLAASGGVVRSKEHPQRGSDDIEACVLVWEALHVADLEPDANARLAREPPRRVDHHRRQIDPRHACSGTRSAQRDRAGARADVEPALTRPGARRATRWSWMAASLAAIGSHGAESHASLCRALSASKLMPSTLQASDPLGARTVE